MYGDFAKRTLDVSPSIKIAERADNLNGKLWYALEGDAEEIRMEHKRKILKNLEV